MFPSNFKDGFYPNGGLALDTTGALYGTTYSGGSGNCIGGCGVIFALRRSAAAVWNETVLHAFTGGTDGKYADAGVAVNSKGLLFGTTTNGGDLTCNNGGGCGVVFALHPGGAQWQETVLHTFEDDATDGGMPMGAVILNRSGNVFGTTEDGGRGRNIGKGTVFELDHFRDSS